jgi:aryl-alcohol dehydrogenase-like predicted oxidoreductase
MLNERGMKILAALDSVAKSLNATPAQVSLAWLLAKGVTAPIASATSAKQLHELLKAVDLKLDSSAVALLDGASGGDVADRPRAPPPRRPA